MIKLIAFDWNGTIFADSHAIHKSDNEVAKFLRIRPISFKDFQRYFDVPVKKFYMALGVYEEELDKKTKQIAEVFHTDYEIRVSKVRSRSGAKSVLEYLSKNNIRSIIFSNHVSKPIKTHLKRLKLKKYFSEVLANSHIESALLGRSKKERLKYYLDTKKISSDEALIVGDTIEEIEIGKGLGITTVAITGGNCSTIRLKVAKPDYLISSLKQLTDIIKKINQVV